MKTFKQETSMSTLNGYVYSIISSPIDPSNNKFLFFLKKMISKLNFLSDSKTF